MIEMRSISIINRDTNQLVPGEELEFILHCKANENVENAYLRFETFFGDETVVGTSFADQSITVRKGEHLDIQIEMDMKNYVTGRYKCIALLSQADERGNHTFFDRVDPAITFEIINDGKGNLVWNHKAWGHIRLNDMHIKNIIRLEN